MIYDIRLQISYDYARPAVQARHVACLLPLDVSGVQRLIAGLVTIDPVPDESIDRTDFFGNHITEFAIRAPHQAITVTLKARVERFAPIALPQDSTLLRDLRRALSLRADMGPNSPLHFLAASARAPAEAQITAFARAVVSPSMTVAQAVIAVGTALHDTMTFDAKATTVDTPAAEAFRLRQGVCQDFSHIMIICLRSLGIPAGYVSGFLRTAPPPGKPRLEGADAMHAWVRGWCGPDVGWLEFDPTNNKRADADHILVAYGRDYSDVAPIKGILRGSGRQKSQQAVDVIPLDPA
ncbi:MAG: transglutaminase family protein [Cypionkella sp.]